MDISHLIRKGRLDPITETDDFGVPMLIGWRRKDGSRKRGEFMLRKPQVWIDRQAIAEKKALTPGAQIVMDEWTRRRRWAGENSDFEDQYPNGELAAAARCYVTAPDGRDPVMVPIAGGEMSIPRSWPLKPELWRPYDDRRRDLAAAGAIYLAEASRLKRADDTQHALEFEGLAMGCAKLIDDLYQVGPVSSGPWMMQPTDGGEN